MYDTLGTRRELQSSDMQVLLHNILELAFGCVYLLHSSVTSCNLLTFCILCLDGVSIF
jgi:hypothetical protein